MTTTTTTRITIEAIVNAPAVKVWNAWTNVNDIVKWNTPSPDWHTTKAEHDLKVGGSFSFRMEARDGSFGFDFGGVYDIVEPEHHLAYTLGDGRKVSIQFSETAEGVHIVETFDAEHENPVEFQRDGWQAILNHFKSYCENLV